MSRHRLQNKQCLGLPAPDQRSSGERPDHHGGLPDPALRSGPSESSRSLLPGYSRDLRDASGASVLFAEEQNALILGGALLFYYFVPIGTDEHPIWRWAVFISGSPCSSC